jgi:hypothetical protein
MRDTTSDDAQNKFSCKKITIENLIPDCPIKGTIYDKAKKSCVCSDSINFYLDTAS